MATHLLKKLCFDLHSTPDNIGRVTDLVAGAFAALGLADETLFDLKFALEEAVANAVEHGNRNDPAKMFHVTCDADCESITVMVRDEGEGFGPSDVPDPTLPENLLKEHGRGIFLIRRLCDEVRYNAKGNEIILVKRFRSGSETR